MHFFAYIFALLHCISSISIWSEPKGKCLDCKDIRNSETEFDTICVLALWRSCQAARILAEYFMHWNGFTQNIVRVVESCFRFHWELSKRPFFSTGCFYWFLRAISVCWFLYLYQQTKGTRLVWTPTHRNFLGTSKRNHSLWWPVTTQIKIRHRMVHQQVWRMFQILHEDFKIFYKRIKKWYFVITRMVQKQVWGMFQNILRRPRRTSCSLCCTVMWF